MIMLKASAKKHESDIPSISFSSTLKSHLDRRLKLKKTLTIRFSEELGESIDYKAEADRLLGVTLSNETLNALIYSIEKRFVVHGDFNSIKLNELGYFWKENCVLIPAITCLFLLERYDLERDFNSLNSAIRINDWFDSHNKEGHDDYMFIPCIEREVKYIYSVNHND